MICLRDCRVTLWALGLCVASGFSALAWHFDNGDGTFTNPMLYADYPDPDIIRVGDDFYSATTTFVNVPGLTLLHSQDLVNWEIVSHVILRLEGHPQYDLKGGSTYRAGVFAPSLCYSDGSFYVVTTPVGQKTRVYYAKDIHGPWQHRELDQEAFDPIVPRFPGGCRRPLPVPPLSPVRPRHCRHRKGQSPFSCRR